MIRKTVVADVFNGEFTKYGDMVMDIESFDLNFQFTISTIRLYETATGRSLFTDQTSLMERAIKAQSTGDNTIASSISNFLIDLIPCLYLKTDGAKIIQNEDTINEAIESPWLIQLLTIDFFTEIVNELNQTMAGSGKRSAKKQKRAPLILRLFTRD